VDDSDEVRMIGGHPAKRAKPRRTRDEAAELSKTLERHTRSRPDGQYEVFTPSFPATKFVADTEAKAVEKFLAEMPGHLVYLDP